MRYVRTWVLLEAQQSYEWYSNSFQGMGGQVERHTGQRWCDRRGSSADDVHAYCEGYVVRILHGDGFNAAGSQQGLYSLNHTMGNNFQTQIAGNNWTKRGWKSGR